MLTQVQSEIFKTKESLIDHIVRLKVTCRYFKKNLKMFFYQILRCIMDLKIYSYEYVTSDAGINFSAAYVRPSEILQFYTFVHVNWVTNI